MIKLNEGKFMQIRKISQLHEINYDEVFIACLDEEYVHKELIATQQLDSDGRIVYLTNEKAFKLKTYVYMVGKPIDGQNT